MSKNNSAVLGLFLTDTALEGVLLSEDSDGTIRLVHRVSKHRSRRGETVLHAGSILPGMKDRNDSDYTLEVGDGSSKNTDLFMAREFGGSSGGSGIATAVAGKIRTESSAKKSTTPFGTQLKEILVECRAAGHPSPNLAFVVGSSEVSYHELSLAQEKPGAETKITKSERKLLLGKLGETLQGEFDAKRTAFVPMAIRRNGRRFLAIVPSKPDPVTTALNILARSAKQSLPKTELVDSEMSLMLSLVQKRADETKGVSAIVRVNSTATTVLFLKDGVLDKYEHLRSLTSYDSVDTVCSRVILKQDELRIGHIDEIFVSTEHQGADAIDGFASFFPQSKVYSLAETLAAHNLTGVNLPELRANSVPAIAVALRVLKNWDRSAGTDVKINFLEKQRRGAGSNRKVVFAWHSFVLMLALFGTSLFYTWTYMTNQEVIDVRTQEMELNPPSFPTENPAILTARVDSLQNVYENHNRAMFVLDSLLTGSDKWSSTLDQLSQSTKSIRRIWFKAMTPQGNSIRLEGNALERSRIAAMAQQWNGSIEKLNFAQIQNMRVYSFVMTVPIESKLPDVVKYLRDNTLDELDPEEAESLTRMADASASLSSNQ